MPFKSKAQRRKFAQLLVQGEISPEVFEEWNRETGRADLPERVKKKSSRKPTRRKRKSPASRTKRTSPSGAGRAPARKKRSAAKKKSAKRTRR